MISQALEERQWREHLRTMRHLPPGTVLSGLSDPDERQLLDELLGLPDDVAPLRWLMTERGRLAAPIALRQMLRSLGRTAEGVARALAEGRSVPEDERRELAPLAPLRHLGRDSLPDAETVRETLQVLRAASDPHQLPPPAQHDERLSLLTELLQLPEGSDPLHWLAAERGALVARVALRDVLHEALPPALRPLGGPLARLRPRQPLHLGGNIRASIERLEFGRDGFAITIRLRSPMERTPTSGQGWRLPFWNGFERVTDDRGYRYLVQRAEWQAEAHLQWWHRGWYRQRLRMTCYPAVAPGVTTLTFSALPVTLAYRLTGRPVEPLQLPDESFGDLIWQAMVPPKLGTAVRAR